MVCWVFECANHSFARIRYTDGWESTVSTIGLALSPNGRKDNNSAIDHDQPHSTSDADNTAANEITITYQTDILSSDLSESPTGEKCSSNFQFCGGRTVNWNLLNDLRIGLKNFTWLVGQARANVVSFAMYVRRSFLLNIVGRNVMVGCVSPRLCAMIGCAPLICTPYWPTFDAAFSGVNVPCLNRTLSAKG